MSDTLSAARNVAPIFVTVLSFAEKDLSNHQCLSMRIEGLCIGGGGVMVGNKQVG